MNEVPSSKDIPPARIRRTIMRALLQAPESLRVPVLAVIGQGALRDADLALLREVKVVRANLLRLMQSA